MQNFKTRVRLPKLKEKEEKKKEKSGEEEEGAEGRRVKVVAHSISYINCSTCIRKPTCQCASAEVKQMS